MKENTNPNEKFFKPDSYKAPNNAQGIKENHIAGINRVVKLGIVIEGKEIKNFKHFKLQQSAVKHHEFELTLPFDALSERQDHQLEQANKFLGKRLTTKIVYKDVEDSPERVFVGVITKVGFSQDSNSLGNIVLKGFSPTILLDSAPHTQSFGGNLAVNTGIIANKVIKQGINVTKNDFDIRVQVKGNSQILYSTQYNETHYNYLCRLAEAYGEQFYYDGEVLHFGNMPAPNPALEMIYGSNITDVNVELKAVHIKPIFYGYNSSSNAKLTSGETSIKHKSDLAKTSYKNNDGIFQTESLQIAPIKAQTDKDVVNSQTGASGSKAVEVFSVSGNTTLPFLYPGCVADIKMRKTDSNETSYFTKLMMTEVTHEINSLGHYSGSFQAIASDTGYLPKPEFTIPIAEPQLATVISNTDPQGQGRVTVKFDWQLHDTTNFIRMMSPDAGGTDQITQNRGYVAIPEVGDQVMVGFVHNNPDRPFVMGGMFHGGTALGGGVNNQMRSIQTKSGIKVLMNDNEKSVTILDPSGNTYYMDGKGNIMVNAPNDMTFTAGRNIKMTAGVDISATAGSNIFSTANVNIVSNAGVNMIDTAGKDLMQSATGNIHESSDMRSEVSENGRNIQAKKSDSYAEKVTVVSTKQNMILQSEKTVKSQSGEQGNSH
ncbi:phage baseplate assembly protein V [Chryseobacterium sp. Ch-15]|uniref:Phage baseplate assembly protein V n=1 Tax=Chryseobacterium muglaense TaxID=2893752 RepID=A0A9Q3UYT2_9FLAO|nr:phage baseplate assembly protein V [Chryseobacterium muglaense]MBD3905420.1 Vgr family protein [Chryseobacterium muglaense]MCC9036506.1 phage baseplate assembly protein V [Chryseobacterium muglaense]MCM2555431.1 phage baseplate assembly protein V [Chryseobacterium muglaense]